MGRAIFLQLAVFKYRKEIPVVPPPPVIVFVTVDTEEDNWGDYGCRNPSTRNIARLPRFQALCERFGAIPTYLCNWPVVDGVESRAVIRDFVRSSNAEVGTHIHAWNTPPLDEDASVRGSMLSNRPPEVIASKLGRLHAAFGETLDHTPVAFRSGRWGFNTAVAGVLDTLRYRVDSSVAPTVDWRSEFGPDYREARRHPYRFHPSKPLTPAVDGALLEVPASIGFLGGADAVRQPMLDLANSQAGHRLRLAGVLDRLRIVQHRWLSPEVATEAELLLLSESLVAQGARFLNFTFHSPALAEGCTPFVRSAADLEVFLARIEAFFAYAKGQGYHFAALGDAPALLYG